MSPVLLDQRRLLLIIAGFICTLVLAFCAGYLVGGCNAETSLPQSLVRHELNLPPESPEVINSEAQPPAETTPGADIDVDVADHKPEHKELAQPAARPGGKTSAGSDAPAVARVTEQQPVPAEPAETAPQIEPAGPAEPAPQTEPAGPAEPAPQTEPAEPTQPAEQAGPAQPADSGELQTENQAQAIVDDASQGEARFSIQVGIYGSLNNAENQVASLAAQNLSAYYQAYQNQKDETRYRVRFGYFASRDSADRALQLWQQSHPGSTGYLVQLTE